MGHYMVDYVKGCYLCNCMKTYLTSPSGKLKPSQVPDHCWQVISVDLIMELQPSRGHDTIMIVVDCLSKRAHVIPIMSDVTASGVGYSETMYGSSMAFQKK